MHARQTGRAANSPTLEEQMNMPAPTRTPTDSAHRRLLGQLTQALIEREKHWLAQCAALMESGPQAICESKRAFLEDLDRERRRGGLEPQHYEELRHAVESVHALEFQRQQARMEAFYARIHELNTLALGYRTKAQPRCRLKLESYLQRSFHKIHSPLSLLPARPRGTCGSGLLGRDDAG
jgi:hypothetical protein